MNETFLLVIWFKTKKFDRLRNHFPLLTMTGVSLKETKKRAAMFCTVGFIPGLCVSIKIILCLPYFLSIIK